MEEKDKISIKDRSKNGAFRVVFGRTLFTLLAVVIQVMFLILFVLWLSEYFVYFYVIAMVVTAMLAIHIANKDSNPTFKMTWQFLVLAVPIFGGVFYVLLRIHPGLGKIKNSLFKTLDETKEYLTQNENVIKELKQIDSDCYGLAHYVSKYGGYPIEKNTSVKYFPLGEFKFKELVKRLKEAKEFIFMEYYIVDDGIMLSTILDILVQKAKEGVEVRFMYDGMCSLKLLSPNFPNKLRKLGIKCKVFSPIRPAISTYQNNRDHRKICVIDGKYAFTGGVNIADEYINEIHPFGHWKDTAVMISGDAVKNFTIMFLQTWNISDYDRCDNYEKYIRKNSVNADGYVLAYGDNPFDKENVGEYVYMDILNNAKEYVYIMTPYLVLDNEMIKCMEYAAKRGVDVRIILPHITDNPTEYKIARTLYPKLIERGIKIYEYTNGFVHAKTVVSDDDKAVVGTINMDFRSMYLNMECAVYMQDVEAVADIKADFTETFDVCEEITTENCMNYSKLKMLQGKVMWLVSPLM